MDDKNQLQTGQDLNAQGKYDDALTLLLELLNTHPKNVLAHYESGIALYHLKRLPESLWHFNQAVQLEPENPFRYSSRAYIRGHMRDLEGAVEDYQKAVNLDPEDAVAYNNLGLMEEQLGRQQNAKRHFNKADSLAEDLQMPMLGSEKVDSKEQGIPMTQKAIDKLNAKPEPEIVEKEEKDLTSKQLVGKVFTDKGMFKEFIKFIRNGFKI